MRKDTRHHDRGGAARADDRLRGPGHARRATSIPMVLLIQRGLVKNRDPKTFFREVVFAGVARRRHARAPQRPRRRHRLVRPGPRAVPARIPAERERIVCVAETPADPGGRHLRARGARSGGLRARSGPRCCRSARPRTRRCSSASTRSTASRRPTTATTIRCAPPSSCSAPGLADRPRAPHRVATAMIEVAGLRVVSPARRRRARRRGPRRARGRVRRRPRAERRRQDHVPALAQSPRRAHRRHGPRGRPAGDRRRRRRAARRSAGRSA